MDLSGVDSAVVMAPHTDDGEIGCGATISWMLSESVDVHYVALSSARQSLVERGLPDDTLIGEVERATAILGLPSDHLHIHDFPVRRLAEFRQEILQVMIDFRMKYQPEIVFCPSLHDIHQDHQTVANETLRAFKKSTIFAYEMPWNNLSFQSDCFFKLGIEHFVKKCEALECYDSQRARSYLTRDSVLSLAKVRGIQIESEYAECFEVMRLVFDAVR